MADGHDLSIALAPSAKPKAAHMAAVIRRIGQHFAQDAGGALYVFERGVYRPGTETVRAWVVKILQANGRADQWSSELANETIEFLRVDCAPPLLERPPLGIVNVRNGLLDVTTLDLGPHDPSHLCPVQLPVRYDQKASAPGWEKFISQVFPEDAVRPDCPGTSLPG